MTQLDPLDHILRMRKLQRFLRIGSPAVGAAGFILGLLIAPGTVGLALALGLGSLFVAFAAAIGLARLWTAQAKAAFETR